MPVAVRASASTALNNIQFAEQGATPTTPASGFSRLYFDSTGSLKWVNDAGTINASLTVQDLSVAKTNTDDVDISIAGSAETLRTLQYFTGTSLRWKVETQDTAESGANAGSDFQIASFSDAGAFIGFGLKIRRSDLNFEVDGPFDHDGSTFGVYGATPTARGALAAPTGTITRTTFDTATVTTAQLAQRVYAMINDFRAMGFFS